MSEIISKKREGVKNEKIINIVIKFILIFMVATLLSQILTIEFFRGSIEIALAIASYFANQRSRSEMIKNVTLIAMVVLLIMGIYDISIALGLI